jgi:hypothetical protein
MMKLKRVKVQYGVQWCHPKDTSEHQWVTPSALRSYTLPEAREALDVIVLLDHNVLYYEQITIL